MNEKTYRRGDWFLVNGAVSVLSEVDYWKYCFIVLKTGNRWSDPKQIMAESFSLTELKTLAVGATIVPLPKKTITARPKPVEVEYIVEVK